MKIAKRKAEQEAIAEAKRVQEAKQRAAYEVEKKDWFARRIKEILPPSAELVSVFIHGYEPGGRVHVGDGVQFDLVRSSMGGAEGQDGESYSVDCINVFEVGSGRLLASKSRRSYRTPAESLAYKLGRLDFDTYLRFEKYQIEELLLEALEKHDEKQQAG